MITKEEARKELVSKLTAKGETLNVSDRTIDEQLEALIPLVATEDMELSDFVDKVVGIFKTTDANVRDGKSKVAKEQLEEINRLKSEIEKLKTTPADVKHADEDPVMKKLAELEAKIANSEREKSISEIKKQLASEVKKTVKNDKWIEKELSRLNIGDDFNLEDGVKDILETYNLAVSYIDSETTPLGSGAPSKSFDKEFEDVKRLREKEIEQQSKN